MKAVVNEIEKKETDFPKLMKTDEDTIVLFHSPEKGIVISSPGVWNVGSYNGSWNMEAFSDLKGSVTLSND